ncbi:DASH family cryptochrome [Lacihabitans sp. LS3-19]|uniref:DASH family cryptochrome n=1 Tax=Lacihabitans sp. LS3-19 TaxID=2487335 RepID=UPI0020CC892C|nr:DASH family cryptochrome [Lacihabitans sp. LS3-19]MCP9767486.1 DASH family cryptochrome [Lacihabitans sp. LS3-19]
MSNVLFWFRNDLRLHDNEALLKAAQQGSVVPVYIIDTRLFQNTFLGFKRTGKFRIKFLLESLVNLKENLQKIGSDLIVKVGIPEKELFDLAVEYNVEHVYCSKEVTQEETTVEAEFSQKLKTKNIEMELFWGNTLVHVRDLPFQIHFVPDVFTDFRKKVENSWKIRPVFESVTSINSPSNIEKTQVPTMEDLGYESFSKHANDLIDWKGGESQALSRLNEYVWEKKLVHNYKNTRNELKGKDFSSKFSAYLSLGCISPRKIYFEIKKAEEERGANESTYWLIFELLWRDYYYFIALKFGVRLFKRAGIKNDFNRRWKRNREHFKRWMDGTTGIPFIDACMRELKETGYLSNRGRQNVSSYFTKDLGLEWWWGAMYFESQLVDYEVCSNWGNWNYLAGIGTDPREDRYFSPVSQAKKYDPQAEYIRFWLPELSMVSDEVILEINELKDILNETIDYPISSIPKNKKW